MKSDLYDVAIVGAGPAGTCAAIVLGRKGHNVLLVERETFPRSAPSLNWASARVKPFLSELGVKAKTLLQVPFRDVTLYNADFSKTARPAFAEPPGFLVDRGKFAHGLAEVAIGCGVTFVQGRNVTEIGLKESSTVVAVEDGGAFESNLLLLASGRGSPLLDGVGFPRDLGESPVWTAQAVAPLETASAPTRPHVAVVLGLDGGGSYGLCCVSEEHVWVEVNWLGERSEAAAALVNLCGLAFGHKVVPVDLSPEACKAELSRSPASAALDMDSHLCKHTLLIGEAGGFVSAVSNEIVYPAMWSAKIAAEVADAALGSVHSQDTLMTFDSQWRTQMADHLRCPHTDIRFLLPLIFSNQPMADRMGAAFFLGENI